MRVHRKGVVNCEVLHSTGRRDKMLTMGGAGQKGAGKGVLRGLVSLGAWQDDK